MSQYLIRRGLLEQRQQPTPHIAAKFPTFKHPRGNLQVTVFLVSNVALSSYWQQTRYSLASRFDRIYCEDGQPAVPAASARGALSRLLRVVLPMFPHRITYDTAEEGSKFALVQAQRDPIESKMAFDSVKRDGSDPLVDPRARRLCAVLEELGDTVASATDNRAMRVAVPWHMYHSPYIVQKLKANGWTDLTKPSAEDTAKEFEAVLATRRLMMNMMMLSIVAMFAIIWLFFDLVFRVVSFAFNLLFGAW